MDEDDAAVRAADAELTIMGWLHLSLLQAALAEGNLDEARDLVEQAVALWKAHPLFDDIDHEVAQRLQDLLNTAGQP